MAKVKNLFVREQMIDGGRWLGAMTTVVGQREGFASRDAITVGAKSAARMWPSAKDIRTRSHSYECAHHDSPLFENSNNLFIP